MISTLTSVAVDLPKRDVARCDDDALPLCLPDVLRQTLTVKWLRHRKRIIALKPNSSIVPIEDWTGKKIASGYVNL